MRGLKEVWVAGRHVLCAALMLGVGCSLFGRSPAAHLATALTAPRAEKRREALVALRGRTTPGMREGLETSIAHELDPAARAVAVDLLAEIGDPASADELRVSLKSDTHWVVRERVVVALGQLLGAQVAPDLEYVLGNDQDMQVRSQALQVAFEHMGGEDAIPLLLGALDDPATAVRLRAASLLEALTGLSAPPTADGWRRALHKGTG
jgi:HEAT repeat protein